MGRIEDGFRRRFRELLARVQPRRLEFGVELLMGRARDRAAREGLSDVDALTRLYEETRTRVVKRVKVMAACQATPAAARRAGTPRSLCDASRGGLARWLRAAGYEAETSPLAGDALIQAARHPGLVLLTTDARLWDRRLIREATVEAQWLPSGLDVTRQLGMVM